MNPPYADPDAPLDLVPQPRRVERGGGTFEAAGCRIVLPGWLERPERLAAERLAEALAAAGAAAQLTEEAAAGGPAIHLELTSPVASDPIGRQGYQLRIEPAGVLVQGGGAEGLLYGLATLTQLVERFGARLPELRIEDRPDFAERGLYEDVTRGKVPTLATMKDLAGLCTALKLNQLQFYVEHTFDFEFDREIAAGASPLPGDEIRELDEFCRDRRIDLVPSLQSFGHMGRLLSLPRWRHLAEVEAERSWETMSWPQRARGLTLDIANPQTRPLIERMFEEFLPAFSSRRFNVCSDETWDLGKGKNAALAEREGVGRLYLEHLQFLHGLCGRHGRRMMFWGDIVRNHPELVSELPDDVIVLDWGYDQDHDFERARLFAEAGLELYICPGTTGWARLLNGVDNAELNIRRFAAAGLRHGAKGFLLTDWGDHGHYNTLGGSMHGIWLGAAVAWNGTAPEGGEFDRIWSGRVLADEEGRAAAALRAQSWVADRHPHYTWTELHQPLADVAALARFSDEDAQRLIERGRAGAAVFEELAGRKGADALTAAELAHGSQMNALLGEKIGLARRLERVRAAGASDQALTVELIDWAERLERRHEPFRRLWLARNKPSRLADIDAAIGRLAAEARAAAEEISGED